jgi:hypothetical protein
VTKLAAPPPIQTKSFNYVTQVLVLNDDGLPYALLKEILPGGAITYDVTAENMGTISFSCIDDSGQLAGEGTNAVLKIGTELQIMTGYVLDNGSYLWPAGVFWIDSVDDATDSTAPGPIYTITGTDRSGRISSALFDDTYNISNGTPVEQAVRGILTKQAPWLSQRTQVKISGTDATVALQVYSPGDDPWQQIVSLCASAGFICYFDPVGAFVARPSPSEGGHATVLALVDGAKSLAVKISRSKSSNPGYNGIIVTGTSLNGNTTISGYAYDMNPRSDTYALGPYGFRPAPPLQDSIATTSAQCRNAARIALPQVLGLNRVIAADIVPVPFLRPYDLIFVYNVATGIRGTFIVQQLTIPLDIVPEALTAVPMGASLEYLSSIGDTPSLAAVAPTSPIYNGNFSFSNFTFSGYSGGATGASPFGFPGAGFGGAAPGFGGFGYFGGGGGGRFGNNWRLTRDGRGFWTLQDGVWERSTE